MRILLVDDDETLIDLLAIALTELNYAVDTARDGQQGWIYGSTYTYDLMILDWSLPKLDGISLCQRFRDNGINTPIILLTSRHGSQNKIRGLDAGADDYICKPFNVEELSARIRALLRRLNCDFLPLLNWGELQLDPSTCQVTYQGQDISLSAKEYRLLELFLRHPQEVLSIEDIIDSLWSSMEYPAEATVRSHIRHLREKLKSAGLPEDIISTVRGQGYCLKSLATEENNTHHLSPTFPERSVNKNAQHFAVLQNIWIKHQPKRQQQLASLEQAISALLTGNLAVSDRLSAIISAHSLAGNLGQFGLDRASNSAREIDQLLQNDPSQEQWSELSHRLAILREELTYDRNITSDIQQQISKNSPLLVIVGENLNLASEAKIRGIRIKHFANPEEVKIWLSRDLDFDWQLPQTILLNISFNDFETSLRKEYLTLVAELKLLEPNIPVIVIADRDRFEDRLLIARHGGSFYLTQALNPRQILDFCEQTIQNLSWGKKIMVVDDDEELLQILPTLLEPWKFKLTTLDDPRQFWDVLQAVKPDLLILDIEMPHFSGIEICKVMRTHPYWCKLPTIFLSVHTDIDIFAAKLSNGTNDFLSKPVVPQKLAQRILNLL